MFTQISRRKRFCHTRSHLVLTRAVSKTDSAANDCLEGFKRRRY